LYKYLSNFSSNRKIKSKKFHIIIRKMRISMVLANIIVIFIMALVNGGILSDMLDMGCLTDSSCRSAEYCDRDFPNPFGKCKLGADADRPCIMDRHCASKKCSFFRCTPRIMVGYRHFPSLNLPIILINSNFLIIVMF